MDLLGGYESDEDEATAPSVPAPSTAAAASPTVSSAFLADTAKRTISPDTTTHVPKGVLVTDGPVHPAATPSSAASESEESDETRRKRLRKEEKRKAKHAAANVPKPQRVVLPSVAGLLQNIGATAMGIQSGCEADTEPSPPAAPSRKQYNALPPPASLIAADQGTEEERWKLRPMDVEQGKKRRFADMPPTAVPASDSSAAAIAQPAASSSLLARATASHHRFAPPQVTRKQANISTEDVGSWSTARQAKRPNTGSASTAANAAPSPTSTSAPMSE